jgi:hypothetical protein
MLMEVRVLTFRISAADTETSNSGKLIVGRR